MLSRQGRDRVSTRACLHCARLVLVSPSLTFRAVDVTLDVSLVLGRFFGLLGKRRRLAVGRAELTRHGASFTLALHLSLKTHASPPSSDTGVGCYSVRARHAEQ